MAFAAAARLFDLVQISAGVNNTLAVDLHCPYCQWLYDAFPRSNSGLQKDRMAVLLGSAISDATQSKVTEERRRSEARWSLEMRGPNS